MLCYCLFINKSENKRQLVETKPTEDGEPWFVAKDVCSVLDIDQTKTRRLSKSQKGVNSIDTLGGLQQMATVNEAGVYKLVFTSRKPEAEKFTDWIAEVVIPSIRKHGAYMKPEKLEKNND